jgi:hypothetical protein
MKMEFRLLARILKEGVQYWYVFETSIVEGWGEGVRENVPLENL